MNFSAVFAAPLDVAFILFIDRNVDVIVENGPLGREVYDLLCILILKLVLFCLKDKVTSACGYAQAPNPSRWACSVDTECKLLVQKPQVGWAF